MTKAKVKVEESSGNVFEDLAHPNPDEALVKAKSQVPKRMGILQYLKLWFSPSRLNDPDFGSLRFVYKRAPKLSHWEGEWEFPKTSKSIWIVVPGGKDGPAPEARQFYLSLSGCFDQLLAAARPRLEEAFKTWLPQDLKGDIYSAIFLSVIVLEDSKARPFRWHMTFEHMTFETTGEKWLTITVPFIGTTPQEAEVFDLSKHLFEE